MKRILLAVTVFIFLSGVIAQAQTASVPLLINYQGRLTDNSGVGLTGSKTLEFMKLSGFTDDIKAGTTKDATITVVFCQSYFDGLISRFF